MTALQIMDVSIRQDDDGRLCVNDLHRASGGVKRHQPSNWMSLQQTQGLIEAIKESKGDDLYSPVVSRQGLGTFVAKELVYAYAMWVSPRFHLSVIQAYDNLVATRPQNQVVLPDFNDPVAAARAWADSTEKVRELAKLALAQSADLEAARPAIDFHRAVQASQDSLSIGHFAKLMGVGEVSLFKRMREEKILISGGEKHNLPYQAHIDQGRLRVRENAYVDRDTNKTKLSYQTRITPKGQVWLHQKFFAHVKLAVADVVQQSLAFKDERVDNKDNDIQLIPPEPERILPFDPNLARRSLDDARKMLTQGGGGARNSASASLFPPDHEQDAPLRYGSGRLSHK